MMFGTKQRRPRKRNHLESSLPGAAPAAPAGLMYGILGMQRSMGNQAVQRILQAQPFHHGATVVRPPVGSIPQRSWNDQRLLQHSRSAEPTHTQSLGHGAERSNGVRHLQRYAFVNEAQVHKGEKDLTPEMRKRVSDRVVRNYTDLAEFKRHTNKETDYLGNLADGTWMRFSPTGINLLGEMHTDITLEQVAPAVGSKSFIYEPFSSDTLPKGSKLNKAYEKENKKRFKNFGVAKESDKQQFGAESLFPKMGFALNLALPYFEETKPMSDLDHTDYTGQPVQRYLKLAWAHSKDNLETVKAKQQAKAAVSPKMEALAKVHTSLAGQLDDFITGLEVDGYIGDPLSKKKNKKLLAPLAEFTKAFTDAIVEMATTDPSSRLTKDEKKALTGAKSISADEKKDLFTKWRDFKFEDNVRAAGKRGVRYAGMGQNHLTHLVTAGLQKDEHPFEMNGKDSIAFDDLTKKLKKAATKP